MHSLETLSGKDSIPITFDKTGAVLLQISNVNNFDTSGEFSFQVIEPKPEIVSDKIIEITLRSD